MDMSKVVLMVPMLFGDMFLRGEGDGSMTGVPEWAGVFELDRAKAICDSYFWPGFRDEAGVIVEPEIYIMPAISI